MKQAVNKMEFEMNQILNYCECMEKKYCSFPPFGMGEVYINIHRYGRLSHTKELAHTLFLNLVSTVWMRSLIFLFTVLLVVEKNAQFDPPDS